MTRILRDLWFSERVSEIYEAIFYFFTTYTLHPPASRFMGKSPEYVMLYTQTYKEKIRSHQVMDATIGCVGGSLVAAFIWSRYYSGELGNYY